MKFWGLVFLTTSLNLLACQGGKAVLSDGNIVLYANSVFDTTEASVLNSPQSTPVEHSVIEMLENDVTITAVEYVPGGESRITTEVSVAEIEQDKGGIIATTYKVVTSSTYIGNKRQVVEYYKVKSNYVGKGIYAKGMPAPSEFEITKVFSCSNRDE